MKISIEISDDKICGALASAREGGGSRYWLTKIKVNTPKRALPVVYINDSPDGTPWGDLYTAPLHGGSWICFVDENEDGKLTPHMLNQTAIKAGLLAMQQKVPNQFAALLSGQGDAETGDVFLQCCLFGECVYG